MVTLKDSKIDPEKKIIDNLDIQIIYIPLIDSMGYKYIKTVSPNDYVYIGQIVAKSNIDMPPLLSSVSGTVVGFENKYNSSGNLVECIVIENDFKEKYQTKTGKKQNITKYSKEEFIYILKECSIIKDKIPAYIKYDTNNQVKYLLINGIEDEIYSSSILSIMYHYSEEILEAIDAIMEIMHISKSYIFITENNETIINKFLKYINTYPNIKIYPIINAYPIGNEKYLINSITNLNKEITKENLIIENIDTIYAIYEALKYHKPLIEKFITISGNGITKGSNYHVKIGTNFSEIATKNNLYKNLKKPLLIAGGAMRGTSIKNDELIITKDLNTILVLEDIEYTEKPCINCGKCSEVCPENLIPSLIIKNENLAKKLKINKCNNCGLCSYICPSKIEVREYLKKIIIGEK